MPVADEPVKVTITLSEARDPEHIMLELEQGGLGHSRLMKITGIVTGSITRSQISRLRLIPGVKSVEESRHDVQGIQ